MTKEEKNYQKFIQALAKLELKHGLFITSNGKMQASNGTEVYDIDIDIRKAEEKELL